MVPVRPSSWVPAAIAAVERAIFSKNFLLCMMFNFCSFHSRRARCARGSALPINRNRGCALPTKGRDRGGVRPDTSGLTGVLVSLAVGAENWDHILLGLPKTTSAASTPVKPIYRLNTTVSAANTTVIPTLRRENTITPSPPAYAPPLAPSWQLVDQRLLVNFRGLR